MKNKNEINFLKNCKNNYLESKNREIIASHIEMLKDSFDAYKEKFNLINNEYTDEFKELRKERVKSIVFEELISSHYKIIISSLKNLVENDKKFLHILIETYQDLWKTAPIIKDKNYLSPYLSDLCRFLYKIKEPEALTFFYNLLIYSRNIPFLSFNGEQEKEIAAEFNKNVENNEEEDSFAEFRKERAERISQTFDVVLFNKAYDRFFLILEGWKDKIKGYYTKDEICFMHGLYIADELTDYVYFTEEEKELKMPLSKEMISALEEKLRTSLFKTCRNDIVKERKTDELLKDEQLKETKQNFENDKDKEIFNRVEKNCENDINIYNYIYGNEIKEKISLFYEKALRYFKRAIHYNPNNPIYYYEYARCLKNSGKSEEAEVFFKKAFDMNG